MQMFLPSDHTFVVCAYQESEYLETCIQSLRNQTVRSQILISTSTPNPYIDNLAEKYDLPVSINRGESGIAGDWNYALSCSNTVLVTLAHQDDIYEPFYTEEMLRCMNKAKKPVFFSSGYAELRDDQKIYSNRLLNIKKILRVPMRMFPDSIFARRLTLAFGDPICCPSVTYVCSIMKRHPFRRGLLASLDWQQWEELSKEKGSFVYSNKPLMCHRIHEKSETSRVINKYSRINEDYQMYLRFWPDPIAKMLAKLYSSSEKSNSV